MKIARLRIACALALALVPACCAFPFVAQTAHADEPREIPLVMIVAGFDGGDNPEAAVPYDESYDWAAALFDEGESPASYYRDMSEGAFTFAPVRETSAAGVDGNANGADRPDDGVVHVTLHRPHGAWGAVNVDPDVTADFAQMVMQALEAAGQYVDFAAYDADGDGTVSQGELAICVCVAGYEAAPLTDFRRDDIPLLWAHAGLLDAIDVDAKTPSGLRFDSYIAIAERYWEESDPPEAVQQEPLGVIYHELGHALGLPDLYAVTYTEGLWADWLVGPLSLMDSGGWQFVDDGTSWINIPTALDAWSRYALGWTNPAIVTHSGDYVVSSQLSDTGYAALVIPTDDPEQYFIVENRQAEGHDVSLAPFYLERGGLLIWHVDNGMYRRYYNENQVNDANHHPAIAVEDAAGMTDADLMLYNSGNDAPDAMKRAGIVLQFDANPGRDAIVHVALDNEASASNVSHMLDDYARNQLSTADEKLLAEVAAYVRAIIT